VELVMDRAAIKDLYAWKALRDRKPLIVKGVRQSGKTYLLKVFGRQAYEDVAYFNFEGNTSLQQCFERDLDPHRIVAELGVYRRAAIKPQATLVIFDEIQFCNPALTALKYFYEDAPEYHIVCAGSLLGISLSKPLSFPVGKVDFLTLRPLSFAEFVMADKGEEMLDCLARQGAGEKVPALFTGRLEDQLKNYYMTGGMPEVVARWIETKDIVEVERAQQRILESYELDFAKHAPVSDIPKLSLIWKSIPDQLSRENGKFIFDHVRPGSRAKDLEDALEWLISAGMVHKVPRIEKPGIPLSAYSDRKYFKLYMADVGLLGRMARLPAVAVSEDAPVYREFKGAMAENFVLTELLNAGEPHPFYWKSNNMAEVDFIVQFNGRVVPVEVKAGHKNRSRSLTEYRKRYAPEVAVRTSLDNVSGGKVKDIPLYMLWRIKDYLA
jgi:predicted AAA+ superfamily ATPase